MLNSMGLGGTASKLQDAIVWPAGAYGEDFTIPRRLRLGVSVSSRGELSTDMRLTLSTGCICLPCASLVVSTQVHAAPVFPDSLSISALQKCNFCSMDKVGVAAHMPGVWQLLVRRCLHRRGKLQLTSFHGAQIFLCPSHVAWATLAFGFMRDAHTRWPEALQYGAPMTKILDADARARNVRERISLTRVSHEVFCMDY